MIVGVLGGGQLARMLALAARPLGIDVIVLEPASDACSQSVAEQLTGPYSDPAMLQQLAARAEVISYEFENVDVASARELAQLKPVFPPPAALAAAQDRLVEKNLFRELGIPVPPFVAVASLDELQQAIATTGLPAVLETRRQGYDGKGQAVIRHTDELAAAWQKVGAVPAIVEALVPFDREVSVVAVRSQQGEVRCYPLSENEHRGGILHRSVSCPNDPMTALAESCVHRLLDHLDYVGVIALELFQQGDLLLANEFAPRVHNSGHWTIEGAETSQFENHIRAICGLPLGSTAAVARSVMLNCIGSLPDRGAVLAVEGAHLHDYGKSPRAGRKVGHITLRCPDVATLARQQQQIEELL